MEFNPEMLVLAREARGLTQTELSARLGVSQSKVSKLEDGLIEFCEETAAKLPEALGFPVTFFYLPGRRQSASPTFYRKHATLEASILKPSVAKMDIVRRNLQRLFTAVEPVALKLPYIDPEETPGGAAEVARRVRRGLRIADGPIRNLTEVMEEAGLLIVPFDFGTRKIDGCGDFLDGVPVVFLNRNVSAVRWRFTLAHELAHLVMHRIPTERDVEEEQANTFAGEFLMPEADIKSSLLPVSIDRLARLKLHWRVSMQALLKRAGDLGLITERTERHHFMLMSKMGIREVEPHENTIPREVPTLLKELLEANQKTLGLSASGMADHLAIAETDFEEWYFMSPALRVVTH